MIYAPLVSSSLFSPSFPPSFFGYLVVLVLFFSCLIFSFFVEEGGFSSWIFGMYSSLVDGFSVPCLCISLLGQMGLIPGVWLFCLSRLFFPFGLVTPVVSFYQNDQFFPPKSSRAIV